MLFIKESSAAHTIFGSHEDVDYKYHEWHQDNFYIFPNSNIGFSVYDVKVKYTTNDKNPNQVNYQRFTHCTQEGDLYLWFLWGKYSTQRIASADYTIKKYMMRRTDPVLKGKLLHKKIYLRHHAPMLLA